MRIISVGPEPLAEGSLGVVFVSVEATGAKTRVRMGLLELRRAYHDRIAELRERSLTVLRSTTNGTGQAIDAFLRSDRAVAAALRQRADEMSAVAAEVDDEVVSLLALESPVARDLRVILASRDVTQLSLLCGGLALALAGRAGSVGRAAHPGLRDRLDTAGGRTIALMRLADAAWSTLDTDGAGRVISEAGATRAAQVEFFSSLLDLTDVPVDVALDLGFSSRAFDRLADHAVEIAERVLFAVHGRHTPVAEL